MLRATHTRLCVRRTRGYACDANGAMRATQTTIREWMPETISKNGANPKSQTSRGNNASESIFVTEYYIKIAYIKELGASGRERGRESREFQKAKHMT